MLLQLRESGTPLEQIQLGRAEDDDETFLDVLDAEQDEWMRRCAPHHAGISDRRLFSLS